MQIVEVEMRKSWCQQHNRQGIWLPINTQISSRYICSDQGSLTNYSQNTVIKLNWLPFSVIWEEWQGLTGKCNQVDDIKNAQDCPCPSTESQKNPNYWVRCKEISETQGQYAKIMDQPSKRKVGGVMHRLEHRKVQDLASEEQSFNIQRKTKLEGNTHNTSLTFYN